MDKKNTRRRAEPQQKVLRKVSPGKKANQSTVSRNKLKTADDRTRRNKIKGSRQNVQKNKPKTDKSKTIVRKSHTNYSTGVVAGIFFVVVIAYLVASVVRFFNKPNTPIIDVSTGSIDYPVEINGLIIRDEKVYTSTAIGAVYFNYNNYDKVKKGSVVCSIKNEEVVDQLETELNTINQDIINANKKKGDYAPFQDEINKRNKQIKETVDGSIINFANGDISSIYSLKESLTQSINVRNNMYLNDNRVSIKGLVNDKVQREDKLAGNIASVSALETGVISYVVDGFEELLTFEDMENLTRDQMKNKIDFSTIKQNKNVSINDNIFKMVESNDWYIGAYIQNELIEGYEENQTRTIYIKRNEDFEPAEAYIYKIIKNEKDSYVLFKFTQEMIKYLDMRNVTIKTTDSVTRGLKIPVGAIVERTLLKVPKSYVFKGDVVVKQNAEGGEKIFVKVVDDSDKEIDYILQDLTKVKYGDTLIAEGEKATTFLINEVKTVKGVYKTNRGYAEFQEIKYQGELRESNGYIILDQSMNPKISVYDRIISDASHISDGERVY